MGCTIAVLMHFDHPRSTLFRSRYFKQSSTTSACHHSLPHRDPRVVHCFDSQTLLAYIANLVPINSRTQHRQTYEDADRRRLSSHVACQLVAVQCTGKWVKAQGNVLATKSMQLVSGKRLVSPNRGRSCLWRQQNAQHIVLHDERCPCR